MDIAAYTIKMNWYSANNAFHNQDSRFKHLTWGLSSVEDILNNITTWEVLRGETGFVFKWMELNEY